MKKFPLTILLILLLQAAQAGYIQEKNEVRKNCLSPFSNIALHNPLLFSRTNKELGEIVDIKKLDNIANEYITFINRIIKNKSDNTLKVRIYHHDDADGVVSAIIVKTFFAAFLSKINMELELDIINLKAKIPKNQEVNNENTDIVFAVDLFFSQKVKNIDMAIDHHVLEENEKIYAQTNPCLVNLVEIGYKENLKTDSKFMPASVLSALILDYTLKKNNISQGLIAAAPIETLNAYLDGSIRGDSAEPTKEFPEKGFKVLNNDNAKAISFISSIGHEGLDLILNSSIENIHKKYKDLKPRTDLFVEEIIARYKKIENPHVAGMFLSDQYIEGVRVSISEDALLNFCSIEKSLNSIATRRVIVVAKEDAKSQILGMSLRFDGKKDLYNLHHIVHALRNPSPADEWDKELFSDGGGHAGAQSIRIPLSKIHTDTETFFYKEILPAVTSSVNRIKTKLNAPSKADESVTKAA